MPAARPGLYASSGLYDEILHIDTQTLQVTRLEQSSALVYVGLAYDPGTDTLYGITGKEPETLYSVDRVTGAASVLGTPGVRHLWGLAFDSENDTLYASKWKGGDGELHRIDTTTGVATYVGETAIDFGGLAYDSKRDSLLAMHDGRPAKLCEIDRATGSHSERAQYDFVNSCGLAYDADLDLFWTIDSSGNLYSYDPNNAYTRTAHIAVGVLVTQCSGLAYVPVPEPATLSLLALGSLAMVHRKRGRN